MKNILGIAALASMLVVPAQAFAGSAETAVAAAPLVLSPVQAVPQRPARPRVRQVNGLAPVVIIGVLALGAIIGGGVALASNDDSSPTSPR